MRQAQGNGRREGINYYFCGFCCVFLCGYDGGVQVDDGNLEVPGMGWGDESVCVAARKGGWGATARHRRYVDLLTRHEKRKLMRNVAGFGAQFEV